MKRDLSHDERARRHTVKPAGKTAGQGSHGAARGIPGQQRGPAQAVKHPSEFPENLSRCAICPKVKTLTASDSHKRKNRT